MTLVMVLALGMGVGCGDDDRPPADAATDSAAADAATDASAVDAAVDAPEAPDAEVEDAGPTPDGGVDAAPEDGGAIDGGELMPCAEVFIPFTGPIPSMTLGATDDFDPPEHASCPFGRFTGPDRVYALIASLGAGTYEVIATPVEDDFNLMLYVVASCDADQCLAGTNLNGNGGAERVELVLDADEVVYVIIDTVISSSAGAFILEARKLD